MARDGGVGDVRQPQLAEQAALLFHGLVAEVAERQETFERQFERFLAQDLGLARAADQRRAGADHRHLDARQLGVRKQALLGRRALAPHGVALPDGERRAELALDQPGQREVEVVAAEQQVAAHRRAREFDAVALARHADQREVARCPRRRRTPAPPGRRTGSCATPPGGWRSRNRTPRPALRAASAWGGPPRRPPAPSARGLPRRRMRAP